MKFLRPCLVLFLAAGITFGCSSPTPRPGADFLVGAPNAHQDDPQVPVSHGNLWYRVSVGDQNLDVHVRLFGPPETTRFFLPGSWQGQSTYADHVRISGARSADGARFLTIDRREGYIDVNARPEDAWIELHYRVDLASSKADGAFLPRFEAGLLVAYAPTFLVLPSQQILDRTADIPIDVHFPESWNVMSTWTLHQSARSKANPNNIAYSYLAGNSRDLGDAFIVAGPKLSSVEKLVGKDEIEVGFSPSFAGDRLGITNLIAIFVEDYRRRFGHLGPIQVFVDTGKPEEFGGLGRRGGFVLLLPKTASSDHQTALLVAHEAFHLWNGHQIIPAPAREAQTRWFKEGLTQWIAVQTACLAPSFGREDALQAIADTSASYLANPLVRGNRGDQLDRLRFPYDHGFLLAMMIDARMRQNRSLGLDGWIRRVAETTDTAGYQLDSLRRSLMDVTHEHPDIVKLWSRHIDQNRPIAVEDAMRRVGLHYIPPGPDTPRAIPLDGSAPVFESLLVNCAD